MKKQYCKNGKTTLNYIFPFLLLLPFVVYSLNYEDEWDGINGPHRKWCKRLQSCIPEKNKTVCGWDKAASFLAVFENYCILLRANCHGAGIFHDVDNVVCETRKNYSLTHPHSDEEFEWIHIEQGTSAPSTMPTGTLQLDKLKLRVRGFQTLYSEGGTLPRNFFEAETHPLSPTTVASKHNAELRDKMLELLWRKSDGGTAGSLQNYTDDEMSRRKQ